MGACERQAEEWLAYWGFDIPEDTAHEARQFITSTGVLEREGMSDWNKQAFQLLSKLIFTGVNAYYTTPVNQALPPLASDVGVEDAIETVGLGLTFILARYLQGRSLQELKDLAAYLEGLLVWDEAANSTRLAFPLSAEDESQVHSLVARVRQRSSIEEYRGEIRTLVLRVVEASVTRFFSNTSGPAAGALEERDSHLEQAIQLGVLEISQSLETFINQLLPSIPAAHLAHFACYVEARLFHSKPV